MIHQTKGDALHLLFLLPFFPAACPAPLTASGYRTFCVFFNANGASVYRASLAFIFSEMIFEGGQKVL